MTDPAASGQPFRNPAFVRIWVVGLLCGVVRWLEMLAFGVFAFDLTGSPSLVALLVMLRFLPLALCGVLIGALSDLIGPRRLLIGGLVGVLTTCAVLFAVFRWGTPAYWHVAVGALISGVFWAGDLPIRRKMMGDAVGPAALSGAMALDGAASNGTRMLGPLVGGALYQVMGIEGVFAVGVAFYAAALAVALPLRVEAPAARVGVGLERLLQPLRGIAEAARHARRDRDVTRILATTIAFNIWGFPYLAMIPVIGRDVLALTPGALGAISAIEGLFAMLGAVALSRLRRAGAFRAIYWGSAVALLAVTFTIGVAPGVWVVAVGLALGGLCAAGFSAMQTTLIYMTAPVEMRGRYLGLMTICIGAGVIGFANVGLTAELFGATNALWIIALEGAIPLLLIGRRWPGLFGRG